MTPTHVEPETYGLKPPGRWPWSALTRLANHLEIPRRLRALVRARESSLVALAMLVGIIAGLVVAAMGTTVDLLHEVFFNLQHGERL
jgi:CIC family chloride channel protein